MKNKRIILLLTGAGLILCSYCPRQFRMQTTFLVWGDCPMCEKRIETAAMIKGVKSADWNLDTFVCTLTYCANRVSAEDAQCSIALAGYDTEFMRAPDSAYHSLPGCCQYIRKPNEP
ncbi:MAG: heavy-metal-associated domain-containing protein [Flavobacteriales bacterium]|nr:heavy-metal-associated domain-containing protein [Flavobacteriales bacterium]